MKKTLISFIFVFVAAFPSHSQAQVMFGGLDVWEFPCTCSPYMYTWFAPLYFTLVPVTGALAVPDTPTAYLYYELAPSEWALGTMTPGVQACWMYAYICWPMPTLGVMDPTTGTGPII